MKIVITTALLLGLALTACSSDSSNEGNACSKNDDCGGNLVCQPISGRNQAYCCPTPPSSSKEANCQAAQK